MDEILSSIRQIIADDDAVAAPEETPEPKSPPAEEESIPSFDAFLAEETEEAAAIPEPEPEEPEEEPAEDDGEALALSLDQVVDSDMDSEELEASPDLVPPEMLSDSDEEDEPEDENYGVPDDIAFVAASDPGPSSGNEFRGSGMPDPGLSGDLANYLLDDTTKAAASHAFSRLGSMPLGAGSQTVEGVIKELLRPMLKSWLDENLPSIVERLVEREIERVSRGGR